MASGQIQFYQYRPDSDARHNAVFTPMPTEQPVFSPMAGYPHPHTPYHHAPQYWHPPQYHPHGQYMPQRAMTQTPNPPLTLTMPMPRYQMEHLMDHRLSSPPTPSLSACPSTASSPPASVNVTPVHAPGYFHLPLESSKEEPTLTIPLMEEWTESHGE